MIYANWAIKLEFPHLCLPPQLLLLFAKENGCFDRCRGWGHEVLMYWNHIIEKNCFLLYVSNEPVIYNCAFYLRRVVFNKMKFVMTTFWYFFGQYSFHYLKHPEISQDMKKDEKRMLWPNYLSFYLPLLTPNHPYLLPVVWERARYFNNLIIHDLKMVPLMIHWGQIPKSKS